MRTSVMTRDRRPADSLLVRAEAQAQSFRPVRQCRRLELVEGYVELSADLIEDEATHARSTSRLASALPGRRSQRC
jgi:methylphosphotriester-DNA--protein-cysteine methyltransferase